MNRRWMSGVVLCIALTAASCSQTEKPDTREADAKAIRELEEAWAKIMEAKDGAKFASYYAADASLYLTGMPPMRGSEAISKGLKDAMADPNFSGTFKGSKVQVAKSGDLAYTEGSYEVTVTDPASKKKVAEKGHYVTNWMKQADGSWKVVADITAAEPPPPPAK